MNAEPEDLAAGRPKFDPPIDWWTLDVGEKVTWLITVSDFTTTLVASYGLPPKFVPPCWYLHDALIQELLALFQYRNQQQFLEVAPPGAPHEFHVQLQGTIARLSYWTQVTGCTEQEHRPTRIPSWVITGESAERAYAAAFESHAAELVLPADDLSTTALMKETH